MKRTITSIFAIMLVLVLVLSLTACGGSGENKENTKDKAEVTEAVSDAPTEPAETKIALGETASTDIVDFKLEKAKISYYASSLSSTYAEPIDKSDGGIFSVAKGRVYICMTFTISNKDRDSLDVGGLYKGWDLIFKVSYNGNQYYIKGYDINEKDGSGGLSFDQAAVSYDGGNSFERYGSSNVLLSAGKTVTLRVVGVAKFEPDSIDDNFDLIVNIPNSSDEYEYYSYEVK